MPPQDTAYLDQLRTARTQSESRAGAAEQRLSDFSSALDRVRGGNIADLQVSDSVLQATLDEYDKNIEQLEGTTFAQTDQYQAAAQGAYRLGARSGRRVLNEARNTINLNLAQLQISARQQRTDAINTYRQVTAAEARSERALALQIGAQAYETELNEEERRNRQNAEYKDTFQRKLLAGEEIGNDFIQQFSESSGRDISDIRRLVDDAGNAAILRLRDLANQEGVPLDENEIDFSSPETTLQSIRSQIESERNRQVARQQRQDELEEGRYQLQLIGQEQSLVQLQANIRQAERQYDLDKARLGLQEQELAVRRAQITAGKNLAANGATDCSGLQTASERNFCRAARDAADSLQNIPEGDRDDPDIQTILFGNAQRRTAAPNEVTQRPEYEAAILNKINEGDGSFALQIAAKYAGTFPELRAAYINGDPAAARISLQNLLVRHSEDFDATSEISYNSIGLFAEQLERAQFLNPPQETNQGDPATDSTPETSPAEQLFTPINQQTLTPQQPINQQPTSPPATPRSVAGLNRPAPAARNQQTNPYGNYLGSLLDVIR